MRIRFCCRFIILVFCGLLPIALLGQNRKTDSLNALLKLARHDTAKVNLLIALSNESIKAGDLAAAKNYVDEALLVAGKTKYPWMITSARKALGSFYHAKALSFQRQSNYSEAIKHYLSAIKIREDIHDKPGLAASYNNMGYVYLAISDFQEALKYYLIVLKKVEELKDSLKLAQIHNNVGLAYVNLTKYDEALKHYQVALSIYDALGAKEDMVNQYFNMGFMYEDIGKYPEALKYQERALALARELDDKGYIAPALHNYGSIFYLQAKEETNIEKKRQLLDKALEYQFNALNTYKEGGIDYGFSTIYLFASKIYFEQGDFTKAKQYASEAVNLSRKDWAVYDTKESYVLLSRIDSAKGDWQGALSNYRAFVDYRDSLNSEENTKKLLQAQMQYVYDKKEDSLRYQQALTDERLKQQTLLALQQRQRLLLQAQDLELLSNEKTLQQLQIEKDQGIYAVQKAEMDRKQEQLLVLNKEKTIQSLDLKKQKLTKNYFIAGLLLFAILSFFIYRNYHTRQKLKLQTLRNKIASDLHDDVGSTLSSISIFSQMAQQQSKEVIPLLETIGDSSRKMLDAMADIVWTIKPENDQFEKIIMRMRSFAYELLGAKHIDFEFVADEEVANMKLPMEVRRNLYLIFKEATNNMVKYSEANRAMFAIKKEKNSLTMIIQDNGKGFDPARPRQGNGLVNMKKRAEEIGGRFLIDSYPGNGTTIHLNVAV